MKLKTGLLVAAGLAVSAGIGTAAVQTQTQTPTHAPSGGAVHRVEKARPPAIRLTKRKRGAPQAIATRVPVLPPIIDLPAAPVMASVPPAAVAVVATDPCVCPATSATPGAAPTSGDPEVMRLFERTCTVVRHARADQTQEDLEAEIVYTLSQTDAPKPVQQRVLTMLKDYAGCGPRSLPGALAGVSTGLRNQRGPGTGSIGGGGFGPGSSSFTSPGIGTGGGSSYYSR